MALARSKQNLQDRFTQQWAILWGRRIEPHEHPWLLGPFGDLGGINDRFIYQLAEKEGLKIVRDAEKQGLIGSVDQLDLSDTKRVKLSTHVIDFYENTSDYDLSVSVKWNPIFRLFGILVNKLFSNRLGQLNIPTKNVTEPESITSEIITLCDPQTSEIRYTIWLRQMASTGQVLYSGAYSTCQLPSGKVCVKAVFPLPNGNATILLTPSVGSEGEFILDSSGSKFGESGFYFLLNDAKGRHWAQFIKTFRDRLVLKEESGHISAHQTLTLWHLKALEISYKIWRKR